MLKTTDNKSIYILGAEAKDLYNSNHLVRDNPVGYSIRNPQGTIAAIKKKFINALDYSIDLNKFREIYYKVFRNKGFSFSIGNKEYSQMAIIVKFSYSYKEFNKAAKNIYVRAGYQYRDIKNEFENCLCVKDGLIVGIEIEKECQSNDVVETVNSTFTYDNGRYKLKREPKTLLSKADLRKELYANGFTCDGLHYVRDKRSSGSSRVGKCMFIYEPLYKKMLKWEMCGLDIKEGNEIDLAAFESYISLPSSSCIDTIEIEPKNFLVIDDYNSEFIDTAVAVEYQNGELIAKQKRCIINNSIFDGQSLADVSLFENYKNYGMLLLRNRFFKSACFNTNIQQWFLDNGITDISQLKGFTLAKDIKDIKIITTPSSIKYLKFGTLRQWFKNMTTTFGLVKHEKPTHFFDGKMVQCHYQLINTLQLSTDEINKLLEPSFDYIDKVREDPDILKFHIKYPKNCDDEMPMNSKNEIIFRLLGINDEFSKTKMYYKFRDDIVKSYLNNMKQGHVLIDGNYSTLLGNGIEMLQTAIGKFDGTSVLGTGNIHSKRFDYGKTILGSRSPHINSGNILLAKNVECPEIDKYFNLSKEIVCINAINENIQQRLNGCDYDSDSLLLTDNKILIRAAKRNYGKFKVPTCLVEAKKTKRRYTSDDKADLDVKTSVNKIGEIVNLSQYLNSLMWNNISKGQTIEQNLPLYYDICKLAVLSGIEIDKAKKEFAVNSAVEIAKLKSKYLVKVGTKTVKPMFFKMITLENGYQLNEKHKYMYFNTPMDYLQKAIASHKYHISRTNKSDVIPFSDIIKPVETITSRNYHKCKEVISVIRKKNNEIKSLYKEYADALPADKLEKMNEIQTEKQSCTEFIAELNLNQPTMYLLLKSIECKENRDISSMIFRTLFSAPNKKFYQMIKSSNFAKVLKIDEAGTISLFSYKFKKILTSAPPNAQDSRGNFCKK